MALEANLTPHFHLTGTDKLTGKEVNEVLQSYAAVQRQQKSDPLGTFTMIVDEGDLDGVMVENYEFVVTRRFTLNGELHLGGPNGEIVNADLASERFLNFIQAHSE